MHECVRVGIATRRFLREELEKHIVGRYRKRTWREILTLDLVDGSLAEKALRHESRREAVQPQLVERLGMLAALQHDAAAASEQYAALQSSKGVMIWLISVDRLLGLLAYTMGELEAAMVNFIDAHAFCLKAKYRPELAWTCSDYAEALLHRNEVGDRVKAVSLLDEALSLTESLRMEPLTER